MGGLLSPTNPETVPVPSVDSAANTYLQDVIGNKTDTHDGNSISAKLHTLEEHAHKSQNCYPTLADSVLVTADASGWTYGSWTEIVPASTITDDFDIHFANITSISAVDEYQLQIGSGVAGSEVVKACISFERSSNFSQEGSKQIQTPILAANSRIAVRLACKSTNARTVNIKIEYHTY